MSNDKNQYRIKIIKNGPYFVSGGVPLLEKIIVPKGNEYEYTEGRKLPQAEEYSLCRCGKSKTQPFCDCTHEEENFIGTETASREKYIDRAILIEGHDVDILDDHRCSLARFCHQQDGTVWGLLKYSQNEKYKKQVVQGSCDCPSGRLTVVDKNGNLMEPEYESAIYIVQDPEKQVSSSLCVRGGIPIESSDGHIYEVRNRLTLCRCGESRNKPFCDAAHISVGFSDSNQR